MSATDNSEAELLVLILTNGYSLLDDDRWYIKFRNYLDEQGYTSEDRFRFYSWVSYTYGQHIRHFDPRERLKMWIVFKSFID